MDEERYWRAVLARDATLDGQFVYAVRSTRIYCRPICSARRPQRTQVVFFAHPAAAEQAGFRACRRCQPNTDTSSDPHIELAQRVCNLINAHPDQHLTLEQLGAQLAINPQHLQRTFKRALGMTPRQYAEAGRLERLKIRLKEGDNVTTALYEAGYGSSSRLYEQAPDSLGMTPATYARGGLGAHINFATATTPLGQLLVAATEHGVCFVCLGEDDAALATALVNEYPAAKIQRDDLQLGVWLAEVVRHLNGEQPHINLPLDVRATAFQWRVWAALRDIPAGTTRSYRQVAETLGDPNSARAVARACASNPVPLIIPCHRVVRTSGELGGYRWGIERKRALLERERNK